MEEHIYNIFPNNIKIDIDTIVTDLLKCGRDREKFNEIMTNLNAEFLGNDESYLKETQVLKIQDSFQIKSHRKNDSTGSKFKENKRDNSFSSRSFITQPKVSMHENIIPSNHEQKSFNNNQPTTKADPKFHRKYTDVHANTKFYYPSDYRENDNDDFDFESGQWTNRANRTLYKRNQSVNSTFISDDYYGHHSNNNTYHNNSFAKDNTNSAIYMRYNKK